MSISKVLLIDLSLFALKDAGSASRQGGVFINVMRHRVKLLQGVNFLIPRFTICIRITLNLIDLHENTFTHTIITCPSNNSPSFLTPAIEPQSLALRISRMFPSINHKTYSIVHNWN